MEPLRFRVITDETLVSQTVWATPNGDDGYGVLSVKAAGKKKAAEDDDDDVDEDDDAEEDENDDDWDEGDDEEEDEWDPDFDEFDLPKSTKKVGGKGDEEEDDLKN